MPIPNGENILGLSYFNRASSCPVSKSPIVVVMKSSCPTRLQARWTDVFSLQQCSTLSTMFCDARTISGPMSRSEIFKMVGECDTSRRSITYGLDAVVQKITSSDELTAFDRDV